MTTDKLTLAIEALRPFANAAPQDDRPDDDPARVYFANRYLRKAAEALSRLTKDQSTDDNPSPSSGESGREDEQTLVNQSARMFIGWPTHFIDRAKAAETTDDLEKLSAELAGFLLRHRANVRNELRSDLSRAEQERDEWKGAYERCAAGWREDVVNLAVRDAQVAELRKVLKGARDAFDAIPEGIRGVHDSRINRQLRRIDAALTQQDQGDAR